MGASSSSMVGLDVASDFFPYPLLCLGGFFPLGLLFPTGLLMILTV